MFHFADILNLKTMQAERFYDFFGLFFYSL